MYYKCSEILFSSSPGRGSNYFLSLLDFHVFSFTSGDGDDDNGKFSISFSLASLTENDPLWQESLGMSASLYNYIDLDYEEDSTHTSRIKGTDLGGLEIDQKVVIKP